MAYKTLFFDLDHTLWDFEQNSYHTLSHIYDTHELATIGVPSVAVFYEHYKVHNDRLWARYRNGFIGREELKWKRMWLTLIEFKIGDERLARALSQVYLEALPHQQALFPFAIEILEYCKAQQYDLNLITNGFEDTQWKKLNAAGIGHYFTHVITSEATNSLKPHAPIFEYALTAAGADKQGSLMIGDSLEADIMGAKSFGMDQVYFNPEKIPHEVQPTFEISCLSELKQIV
ncbi:noncanonical pyrimidine nucleotidase, YjjG family [Taibaiella sp. KBW10]|uniref:YjjG family noncanonical pyrimidine nucleotidase n=1 Tax=Taibaiella sp. KBW10 TaxID=2153357 RepID=UPI000F5AAFB9|nr:YjjG family noncanonical pyrimidine nucleotidase [Taibaiella sp. KBW10]RQO31274.1 noncanonical pyrimidine nucleotidase, YjjG family [Taibaiella sp. KBW10]